MFVIVQTGPVFKAAKPTLLFEFSSVVATDPGLGLPNYDVAPDGERLLMIKSESTIVPTQLNVILNWFEELKPLVPTEN
jgi:hypothetical protein